MVETCPHAANLGAIIKGLKNLLMSGYRVSRSSSSHVFPLNTPLARAGCEREAKGVMRGKVRNVMKIGQETRVNSRNEKEGNFHVPKVKTLINNHPLSLSP